MEKATLMPTLFYDDMYNRDGHRMRSVFVKEVTDGIDTYRLWRAAGVPDFDYPRTPKGAYLLFVELNGVLAPLRMTEEYMLDHIGWDKVDQQLYGGRDKKYAYYNQLRKQYGYGSPQEKASLRQEEELFDQVADDHAEQAAMIRKYLEDHKQTFLAAKESGGQTFPDFIGALMLNELPLCVELRDKYKAIRLEKEKARAKERLEKERQLYLDGKLAAEKQLAAAKEILLHGGTLKNDTIQIWNLTEEGNAVYRAYSIVLYLMRQYGMEVPLRTQGWINERLTSAVIADGKMTSYRYQRSSKKQNGSNTIWMWMEELIHRVCFEQKERQEESDEPVSKSVNNSDM